MTSNRRTETRPSHPAIYARVSTYDQDHAMQVREGKEWFKRMGYPEPKVFIDHGISGAKRNRPAFNELMKLAGNPIDLIWVSKCDRFGRSLVHFLESIEKLDKLGVRFVAPAQMIDTDNATGMGRLMMHLLAMLAEFERNLIMERSYDGRMQKLRTDQPDSWNLIFGFEPGKPIINQLHQKIMQQIFDWRDQDYSFYEIEPMVLALANRLGVKPPRGGKTFWPQTMRTWVISRQCIGEFHRRIKIDGKKIDRMWPLPLLIDPVQWTRVNAKREKIRRLKIGNPQYKFLLTGFLRSVCDKPMNGLTTNEGRNKYYRCDGLQRRSKITSSGATSKEAFERCGCAYQKAEILELAVWPVIWNYLMDPAQAWRGAKAIVDEENAANPAAGRDAKAERDEVEREIATIQRGIRKGSWDEDEGAAEIMKLRERKTTLETEIHAVQKVREIAPLNAVKATFEKITEGGEPKWEHRREVLDGLIDLSMRLEGNEVVITGAVPLTDEKTGSSSNDKWSERITPRSICQDPIPFVLRAKVAA